MRIVLSVTNDLVTDQRVHKVASTLSENGANVLVIGRKLPESRDLIRSYSTKRLRLLFKKGVLFYAFYNIRLLLVLMFVKVDILVSNDLDTLLANFIAAKLRRKKMVYDSHEYFTEVPELVNRKRVQNVWLMIERRILPQIKYAYTVNNSLRDIYKEKYSIEMEVVRNVPFKSKTTLNHLGSEKPIILYQGAVNLGRGIERLIEAAKYMDDALIQIIGGGDLLEKIKQQVIDNGLSKKVNILGRLPFEELQQYTQKATIGVSLEENMGLNYYYALPNKIFDYIQASIPILCANLPEMTKIVIGNDVGKVSQAFSAKELAAELEEMLADEEMLKKWKDNCKIAANELCWEKESNYLLKPFKILGL